MNIDLLLQSASESHRLIVSGTQVFINVRDATEAERWQDLGCTLRPWQDAEQAAYRAKRNLRPLAPGWEVHLIGACDRVWEDDADGNQVDVTVALLKERALGLVGRA